MEETTAGTEEHADAVLVNRSLAGDGQAFDALVRRYQNYAYGTAIGLLSDFELARDAVQEAFLIAYCNLGKLRRAERFAGWLQGIVRNICRRVHRELARARDIGRELAQAPEVAGIAPGPDRAVEEAETRRMVRRALQGLGDKNREALSLFYVDGLSYREIAGYLEVTETAVRGRLERGRADLRRKLGAVARAFKEEILPVAFAEEIRNLLDQAKMPRMVVHRQAARRLADLGSAAVRPLCEALTDDRSLVRKVAAEALCLIGDPRALQPMVRMLMTPGDRAMHHVDLLYYRPTVLRIPGMHGELLKAVRRGRDIPADILFYVIGVLGEYCTDAETSGTLLGALRNTDLPPRARNEALRTVCSRQPEFAESLIIEAFGQPELVTACWEAWGLAERHDILIPIDLCLHYIERDARPTHRVAAARHIVRHGDEGRRAMERLLHGGSQDQRATAALVLSSHLPRSDLFEVLKEELLHGCLEGKWPTLVAKQILRSYTDRALAWSRNATTAEASHPPVAWLFARLRVNTGQATSWDMLLCGGSHARRMSLRKLVETQGAEAIPELRRTLRETRPQQAAREAFRQMRRMRERALPDVLEMLSSEYWGERKAAVGLLRQWSRLTDSQRENALADPHIAVRHAALGYR